MIGNMMMDVLGWTSFCCMLWMSPYAITVFNLTHPHGGKRLRTLTHKQVSYVIGPAKS